MTMAQTKTSQGPRAEPVGRRVRLSVWCALPRTLGCLSNVSTFYFAHYMPFHGQSRGTVESEWSKVLSSYHGVWGSNGKGMGVGRGEVCVSGFRAPEVQRKQHARVVPRVVRT